jgi:hypothetical protein
MFIIDMSAAKVLGLRNSIDSCADMAEPSGRRIDKAMAKPYIARR